MSASPHCKGRRGVAQSVTAGTRIHP
uniref:Uncharacterized protein n=1 Tax=Anguilla anguilla TaxID=7936 RepID=A0A0E9SUY2_ANGAN